MHMADGKPSPDFYIRSIATFLRCMNDQKLSEFGITTQQARLLGSIRRSLHDGAAISRKFLGDRMGIRGPSVTSLLNGLEKKGFIVRNAAEDDRRAMQIQVTEKGGQVMAEADQVLAEMEEQMLSGLTEVEKVLFAALLHKVFVNIAPDYTNVAPLLGRFLPNERRQANGQNH
jgi:DNA-binding MarR family transcriptional regulator